jgi:hypothetical protein
MENLSINLMSISRITRNDEFGVDFCKNYVDIYDTESKEIIFSGIDCDGLKYVLFKRNGMNAMLTTTEETTTSPCENTDKTFQLEPRNKNAELIQIWHRRMGHISGKYLQELMKTADGIPHLKITNELCDCRTCAEAKSHRLPHNQVRERPKRKFEIIASDVLDPKAGLSEGKKLIVTFTDIFLGFLHAVPISLKSKVPLVFLRYHKKLTNRTSETSLFKYEESLRKA